MFQFEPSNEGMPIRLIEGPDNSLRLGKKSRCFQKTALFCLERSSNHFSTFPRLAKTLNLPF